MSDRPLHTPFRHYAAFINALGDLVSTHAHMTLITTDECNAEYEQLYPQKQADHYNKVQPSLFWLTGSQQFDMMHGTLEQPRRRTAGYQFSIRV